MMNFVRYNPQSDSFHFAFLQGDLLAELTKTEVLLYLKQQEAWLFGDEEILEPLFLDAKLEKIVFDVPDVVPSSYVPALERENQFFASELQKMARKIAEMQAEKHAMWRENIALRNKLPPWQQ